jgi:RHH-type proline utilization regulon transcriptional repressor/proline dehydrogenase/delta 1-pyrroline-5-carboxylate dehydrogenase
VALFAETGGKNATIITGSSDRELAIKHLADSFRNDGQKCSVTSLVLVTPDVYGDKVFWAQLKDAVASLPVGSAWDPASVITPLVRAPGDELRRGLTVLEPGEEWVLEPRRVDGRDDFWTPGIKRGSRRGSFTHLTELFGPVMTVMRVRDLDDALAAIRETGYGLTLGIETLDDAEARHVVERAPVGVIYVRRSTVGAIAGRQSFGGWRDSRRGPGFHAGGINYVTNLMSFKENGEPPVGSVTPDELLASYAGLQADAAPSVSADAVVADALKLLAAAERLNVDPAWRRASIGIRSAAEQWVRHFSRDHRPSQDVRGEDNVHRYRPLGRVVIRLSGSASSQDGLIMLAAARLAGNDVEVSHASGSSVAVLMKKICPEISTLSGVHWTEEDATLASLRLVVSQEHVMLRYADPAQVEKPLLLAAAEHPRIFISSLPPLMTGRIELLRYVQEQTVSDTYHRYGGDLRAKDAH